MNPALVNSALLNTLATMHPNLLASFTSNLLANSQPANNLMNNYTNTNALANTPSMPLNSSLNLNPALPLRNMTPLLPTTTAMGTGLTNMAPVLPTTTTTTLAPPISSSSGVNFMQPLKSASTIDPALLASYAASLGVKGINPGVSGVGSNTNASFSTNSSFAAPIQSLHQNNANQYAGGNAQTSYRNDLNTNQAFVQNSLSQFAAIGKREDSTVRASESYRQDATVPRHHRDSRQQRQNPPKPNVDLDLNSTSIGLQNFGTHF
jgi:hypothetical protein